MIACLHELTFLQDYVHLSSLINDDDEINEINLSNFELN